LAIYFILFWSRNKKNRAVIPKGHAAKATQTKEKRASRWPSAGQLQQKESIALHGALCASLGGAPPHKSDNKRNEKKRENAFSLRP